MGVIGSYKMVQFGLGFLLPRGSHPASRDLKPGVPVEAFLSGGHVDVEGFLEWQSSRVFGLVNHTGGIQMLVTEGVLKQGDFL